MTDNTTYREQGRALILAALMVLSVVAMSAAFAGGAAAGTVDDTTNLSASDVPVGQNGTDGSVANDQTVTFDLTLNASETDTVTINTSDDLYAAGVAELADSDVTASASSHTINSAVVNANGDVEVQLNESSASQTQDTVTVTLSLNTEDATEATGLVYEISASSATQTTSFALTSPTGSISGTVVNSSDSTAIEGATVHAIQDGTAVATATTGTNGGFTLNALRDGDYDVVADASGYRSSGVTGITVNDGTDTALSSNLTLDPVDVEYQDANGQERSLFYQGQKITATGLDQNSDYQLRSVDSTSGDEITGSSFVDELSTDATGQLTIDSSNLQSDNYFLRGEGVEETTANSFEVTQQKFDDASFASDSVTQGDTVDLTFDSNRATYDVNVTADGLSAAELESIFQSNFAVTNVDSENDRVTLADVEGTAAADFTGVDAGDYTFNFDVTDTSASESATITVEKAGNEKVSFTESDYSEQRSNIASIGVELENTDEAYVQIGDENEVNYEVVLHVEDGNNDGVVTIEADTTQMHSNDPAAFWAADASDGDSVSVDNDVQSVGQALEAGDYTISIASDAAFNDEQDTAFFTLTERSPLEKGALDIYTAPDDVADLEDFEDTTVTETGLIAQNDTMLASVEMSSLHAYFQGATTVEELEAHGFDFQIEEKNPGPNADPAVFNASDDDVDVTIIDANQSEERVLLVVDYSNADNGADQIELDTDYEARFMVSDSNDFVEETESAKADFVVEERNLEWDDSAAEVPNIEGATVTGTTNVAPGTEVNSKARASGVFTKATSTVVETTKDGDRFFALTYDFSGEDAGTEFQLTANEKEESAQISSVLVEGEEKKDDITVSTDAPSEVDVGADATLDVTVTNNADETKTIAYSVLVNGDDVSKKGELEIGAGESVSNSYTLDTSEAGDISWEVTAGDKSDSGTVTVTEPEKKDDSSSDDSSSDDSSSDDSSSDDSHSDDSSSSDDGTPGFGVGVALVALLAAAMLALRRQN